MVSIQSKLNDLDFSQPLSLRSIVYRVNNKNSMEISKKKIRYYLHNSNEFKLVKPIEVGSGKHKLNVWKKVL
jgi:repressor of nif and glnA expression